MRQYGKSYFPKEKNPVYKLLFIPPVMVALLGLAYGYAYITMNNPVPESNFLVTLGYCFVIGYFYYYACIMIKVKGIDIYIYILLIFGIVTIHIFWASYLHLIYHKEVGFISLLTEPCLVVDYISKYSDNTKYVERVVLSAVGWVFEAGLFLFSIFIGLLSASDKVYCDFCDVLVETEFGVAYFSYSKPEELLDQEYVANMRFLEDCEPAKKSDLMYYRLDLKECPKCEWTNLMSIMEITVTRQDEKNNDTKNKVLYQDILLSKLALEKVTLNRDRLKYNPNITKNNSDLSPNEESET